MQTLTFENLRTQDGKVVTILVPEGTKLPNTNQITATAQAEARKIIALCLK